LKHFILSFFLYSMGLQTVMYMAPTFAEKEITGMTSELLIITTLIIQLVAIVGAFMFSWLSAKYGNLKGVAIAVLMWILILVGVYFVHHVGPFLVVAFFVGLIMGGSQSLSRSTYSKLLPETEDHASYFSFYDVAEKMAIVIGTLTCGYINEIFNSTRSTIFPMFLYFLAGLIVLVWVIRKGDKSVLQKVAPLKK
jgi:MFS transporter, UMF1 family